MVLDFKQKKKLYLIGDFKFNRWGSFAPFLSLKYEVRQVDVNKFEGKLDPANMNSIHNYAPLNPDAIYFVIQNRFCLINDEKMRVAYLHFDYIPQVRKASVVITPKYGAENCGTRTADHYSNPFNDRWESVEPFFDPAPFVQYQQYQERTILISDIPDTVPFEEYRLRLCKSEFLIVKGTAIRKRAFEALYCGVAPLICCPQVTRECYERLGFEDKKHCYFFNFDSNGYWTGNQTIFDDVSRFEFTRQVEWFDLYNRYHIINKIDSIIDILESI